MKSRDGKSQRREEEKKEDHKRESLRRKKIQVREKVGKSRNTVFFQWFVAPEGRNVGSLKRRVRIQLARWEMKNCTPFVARSTFRSLNVQNTPCSDHFWKLRCRKSARRCGPKHISKSKCTKHTMLGPLLEVEMSKKVHAVVARSTFRSLNVQNAPCSDHFWKLRCRKSARRCGPKHISKSKCTKHTMLGPLLEVEMSKKCMPLWREAHFTLITLHYATLHYTTLNDTALHLQLQPQLQLQLQLHYITLH